MRHKHITEEIHFDLNELLYICSQVIRFSDDQENVSKGVLKLAKALILNTSFTDKRNFRYEDESEVDELIEVLERKLYERAEKHLGEYYYLHDIRHLSDIDDEVEYL